MSEKTADIGGRVAVGRESCVLPEVTVSKLSYLAGLPKDDYRREVGRLGTLNVFDLTKEVGYYQSLPYETLSSLLPEGSDDVEVAQTLRLKREMWLKEDPRRSDVKPDSGKGVITFSGQFVPWDQWMDMTMGQRRTVLVGTTCSHYEHDVSWGDDSNPTKANLP